LREHGVECILAPFEADAQLCYLEKIGYIDVIMTKDSDLIAYGAHTVGFFPFGIGYHVMQILAAVQFYAT
jgi:exonuclease-1